MSVIVLDDICNLNCDYCFYSTVMWSKREELIKSWKLNKDAVYFNVEHVKKLADKLIDSHFEIDLWKQSVVISWWEPTMHPEFIPIMTYFIRKWLTIHLLTNFVFPKNQAVYKFLMKNKKNFRFLVNFNEIARQPASKVTKQNLIDFNYDQIKIWLNLYHANYHFDDFIDILKQAPNIHIIRLWLPNTQVDEWINMWVIKAMKEVWIFEDSMLDMYKKDLFDDDLQCIKDTQEWLKYWLMDEKIHNFYKEYLWKELQRFIWLLKENNLDQRVQFYIDCWFDYKILPEDACWFLLQRLYYKNPCSIPNWVCIQTWWEVQQCYAIWTYWNFTKDRLWIEWKSIRKVNNYYTISSLFLQFWLLNQMHEYKFEMCRWNNLRFFKQLFTKWTFNRWTFTLKDYNISKKWDQQFWYELKDHKELVQNYLNAYKETKHTMFIVRIYQLLEYCFVHFMFDKTTDILWMIQELTLRKIDDHLEFYIQYYTLLNEFSVELQQKTLEQKFWEIDTLRDQYLTELQKTNTYYNETLSDQPTKQLVKLENIVKTIIKRQIYIE